MHDSAPPHSVSRAKTASGWTEPLTVAAAIDAVEHWNDLRPIQQRDLVSALNTAARIARLPAQTMPLTPTALRPGVLTVSGAQCGVSPGRIRNLRSLLAESMRRLDIVDAEDGPISATGRLALTSLRPQDSVG